MIKEGIKNSFIGKAWTYFFSLKSLYEKKFVIPTYDEKRKILGGYQEKFKLTTLVETGTFLGDTVEFFKNRFEKVYSIELSEELALKAQKRFETDSNITIIHGDSGEVLSSLVDEFEKPALFWLDGHYSSEFFLNGEFIKTARSDKNTPVEKELDLLLSSKVKHVILIDDARLFTGKGDYPTIRTVKEKVRKANVEYEVFVKKDIINIIPA